MVASTTTLRDFLIANWRGVGTAITTDRVDIVPFANMKEIVTIYDRPLVEGNELAKTIAIDKATLEEQEGLFEHPNYTEVWDDYYIEVRYRVKDVQGIVYTQAESDIQEITQEVVRILKLRFNPANGVGTYFRTRNDWQILDQKDGFQVDLRRRLTLRLWQLRSEDQEVFLGFNGILTFDVSESEGDNPPAGDFIYTELRNVIIEEGFAQIPRLTKDTTKGAGVPLLTRGQFRGSFTALLSAKRSDITQNVSPTTNQISQIGQVQQVAAIIGQVPEVAFIHATANTETVPVTLNTTSFFRVENVRKIDGDVEILQYELRGRLTRPTVYNLI